MISAPRLLVLVCLVAASTAHGAVVPFTELFPSAAGVPAGWTGFVETGGTVPTLANITGGANSDDDGSTLQAGPSLDGNMDGSLLVNTQAPTPTIDMGVFFDAAGTIDEGEEFTLQTRFYNPNVSFILVNVALENATDGSVLAESGLQVLNAPTGNYRTVTLNYTATASDAGDTLRIRYTGLDVNSTARDFSIDNLQLTVTPIPEPAAAALSCLAIGAALVGRRRQS